ncbi:MAG TPA: hypothetical protein DEF41_04045 [Desulfovibrio sp.]|uniref:Uncharacterized protein n=1 Tax=Nitratidesulfovibrio vulgaris (strain ATCC 29579 / DSM 644 / CCUG 34227 / NCIMB 8303 / VKM B-1760 / Hildenborough) TaxID=882 RepID=Q728K9_NITV2|nr:hypothetical protein DVU_2594 [Nitratidesulfovibrio vulgaris str. Hildenborough]HBW15310.1 hypothetical protein [Desulfovibrio sp.]
MPPTTGSPAPFLSSSGPVPSSRSPTYDQSGTHGPTKPVRVILGGREQRLRPPARHVRTIPGIGGPASRLMFRDRRFGPRLFRGVHEHIECAARSHLHARRRQH